jgi:protocatechuate 3,4-dioxygenase beta subunit
MKILLLTFLYFMQLSIAGCSQPGSANSKAPAGNIRIGGMCEGCEAIYESPVPLDKLNWIDTLPDFFENGPKLEIRGIVYRRDGKTPAAGVVIYVYHTDQTGRYSTKGNETGWGKRHGYVRGWMKTNADGAYKFFTLRPASYPQSSIPAHIHPVIKEAGKNEYWIDEYLFDDDVFLTAKERASQKQYGGSGIIYLKQRDGLLVGERNIVLGLNVPNYTD